VLEFCPTHGISDLSRCGVPAGKDHGRVDMCDARGARESNTKVRGRIEAIQFPLLMRCVNI
jgi:hypothetical protein